MNDTTASTQDTDAAGDAVPAEEATTPETPTDAEAAPAPQPEAEGDAPAEEAKAPKARPRGEKRTGWLPRRDSPDLRVGATVAFGPEVSGIRPLVRLHRWLNLALADYRPILFHDTAEEQPNQTRIYYWRMRRDNKGWDELSRIVSVRLFWAHDPDLSDLDPVAAQRVKWIFRESGATFLLVVPEWMPPEELDQALVPLRNEICLQYLETPLRSP